MKIIFLGTSSGKASLNRYHSSLLLSVKNYNLLIDAGDGISRALLHNKVEFNSVSGILLTHLHPDHFTGLPLLIVQMKMMNRVESLDIHIHEDLVDIVKEFLLNTYQIPERIKFEIRYKIFEDNRQVQVADNLIFLAKQNTHLQKLEEYKSKYPSLNFNSSSFLFTSSGKNIIYTSDIGSVDDLLLFDSVKPDLLISEVTHISANELLDKAASISSAMTFLTHYSDEQISPLNEILTNHSGSSKGTIKLATGGESFEI
jgi:ribonuclease Z